MKHTPALVTVLLFASLTALQAAEFKPAVARLALDRDRVPPGGTIQATYTFRSRGQAAEDLTVFVHVVRPDGRHIGADFSPDLPVTKWPANGFVREGPFPIAVPADAAPGKYRVWVGLFSSRERIELDNTELLRGSREYQVGEFHVTAAGTATETKPAVFAWLPVDESKVVAAPPTAADSDAKTLTRLTLALAPKVLYPVREKQAAAKLTLTGFYADGSQRDVRPSEAVIRVRTKIASGNVEVAVLDGDKVVPKEGGIATVEATVRQRGQRLAAERGRRGGALLPGLPSDPGSEALSRHGG